MRHLLAVLNALYGLYCLAGVNGSMAALLQGSGPAAGIRAENQPGARAKPISRQNLTKGYDYGNM